MDDDKAFYQAALGITRSIPSEETLRQRMDDIGDSLRSLILDENIRMLLANKIQPGVLSNGFVPVDIDVTPMDNSKSGKEGVSRTYKGYDGYAPMMAYIGIEGYAINFELREGKQHCQNGTVAFLQETIKLCKKLTDKPLLIRLDSGNDSIDNVAVLILVLELTIIAYNILRMIGRGTIGGRAPRQKRDVKRRRMRTVISNLIMMASHITTHARQLIMGLGKSNIWRHIFADYCENNILATA